MSKKSPLAIIFLVVFIDLLGFGILIPILPTFAVKEIGMGEAAIGIVIAAYSLTQFIFTPLIGGASDKYGRRGLILVTLLLNAIGYVIFAYSHSFAMLLLSRVVAGVGGSSIGVAQAYIADVTTKENRSKGMGMIGVAFGLGFVFGPLIGGWLAGFGYFITGMSSAAFSVFALALSFFLLPESLVEEKRNLDSSRKIFNVALFKKIITTPITGLVIGLFFLVIFSVANIYGTFALLCSQVYGLNDLHVGYLFAILGTISVAIQGLFIAKLAKRYSDIQIIAGGSFFLMIGLALMPYGVNFVGLALICILLSFGTGSLQPTLLSLISKVTNENEQGAVLGVNQSFSSFGRMLGPLWGGFAFEYLGYEIPFLTGALFAFLIFVFSLFYLQKYISTEKLNAIEHA